MNRTAAAPVDFQESKRPPQVIELLSCPTCGRNDRTGDILRNGRYAGGKKCPGAVVGVLYEVEQSWRG